MGKLYIVATPIGNIEDITLRAIRVLKEVDLILCENVSESHRLLKHYDIQTATTNYYSNSRLDKIDKIIEMLEDGKDLALISDAGTPCVSDPGSLLVNRINEYANTKIEIITIPGPSAVTSLYSISGVMGNRFAFYGFVPQKKGRQTFIRDIINKSKDDDIPIMFYESVHRFEKFLDQLHNEMISIVDANDNTAINKYKLIVGRELTKMHEQVISGNVLEVKEYFNNNKSKVRGEFVIMLAYKSNNDKSAYTAYADI